MKSSVLLLAACLVVACVFAPFVSASQSAIGTQIGGSDNHQVVTNNDNQQSGTVNQVGGKDNTAYVTNINGDITNGANSVSNSQDVTVVIPSKNSNYELGIYDTENAITTLYSGQVVNWDLGALPKGVIYNFTWTSAVPVMVYVVNTEDVTKATNTNLGVMVYNDAYNKWEHSGVYHYPVTYYSGNVNEGFSRSNAFQFIVPEDGSYSFVMDTRPAVSRNGYNVKVSDDTIDVVYSFAATGREEITSHAEKIIGTHEECQIPENRG